jgi:hypothetical protein
MPNRQRAAQPGTKLDTPSTTMDEGWHCSSTRSNESVPRFATLTSATRVVGNSDATFVAATLPLTSMPQLHPRPFGLTRRPRSAHPACSPMPYDAVGRTSREVMDALNDQRRIFALTCRARAPAESPNTLLLSQSRSCAAAWQYSSGLSTNYHIARQPSHGHSSGDASGGLGI